MWCCGRHIELDITNAEIGTLFEDPSSHHEEGHKYLLEYESIVSVTSLLIYEVFQNCLLHHI